MSKKTAKIAALIAGCRGQDLNANYLGYFACFNQGWYYEAHDVLEELWLSDRQSPNYSFYKGLIQLAGAFVHLQKNRLSPAAALFKLARTNLQKYPATHEHLDVAGTLEFIEKWLQFLEQENFALNPLDSFAAPRIDLMNRQALKTFLIATRNLHKVEEIRAILSDQFAYLTLQDFPDAPPVVEDADTFAGNATKKAVELAQWLARNHASVIESKAPLFVLADDSGLEVDALNGAPGVYSARFAALDTSQPGNSSDAANNSKLLRLLEQTPASGRQARFRCVLALTPLNPGFSGDLAQQTKLFDGTCEGHIALTAAGKNGFGYDPLFMPEGQGQSFAELGDAIKNKLSHRGQALKKLRANLGL